MGRTGLRFHVADGHWRVPRNRPQDYHAAASVLHLQVLLPVLTDISPPLRSAASSEAADLLRIL